MIAKIGWISCVVVEGNWNWGAAESNWDSVAVDHNRIAADWDIAAVWDIAADWDIQVFGSPKGCLLSGYEDCLGSLATLKNL